MPEDAPFVFQGGLVVVAVLSAVVIAALLVPGHPARPRPRLRAAALDRRSAATGSTSGTGRSSCWWSPRCRPGHATACSGWALGGIALAITVVAAALSYRFVEQPIRRNGFRATWRAFADCVPRRVARVRRRGAASSCSCCRGHRHGGRGDAATRVQARPSCSSRPGSRRSTRPTRRPRPTTPEPSADARRGADAPIDDGAAEAGRRRPDHGDRRFGDARRGAHPAGEVPGHPDRRAGVASIYVAPDIIQRSSRWGSSATSSCSRSAPTDRSTATCSTDPHHDRAGPRDGRRQRAGAAQLDPGVNSTLSSFALDYRDVELANWHDAIQPSLNLLAGDQIHFGTAGATIFSATIRDALQRLAELPPLRDDRANQSLPQPV